MTDTGTRRRDMRPGTVFGINDPWCPLGLRGAFVVVDRMTEIEFWTGTKTAWGDVCPSVPFEVIA